MKYYTAPSAETICVMYEQNVMSQVYGTANAAGGDLTEGNTYDL